MPWPTLERTQFAEFDKFVELCAVQAKKEELLEGLHRLDTALEQTHHYFVQESEFIEPTGVNTANLEQIREALDKVRSGLERLEESLDDPDHGGAILTEFHGAILKVTTGFEGLRQEAAKEPTYSEVPYIQELFRVTRLVAEERLPRSALERRLVMFEFHHRQLGVTLSRLKFPDRDGEIDAKAEFRTALKLQQDAISGLWAYLESGELSTMEQACVAMQETGAKLLEIQKSLPKEATPVTVDGVVHQEASDASVEETSHLQRLRQLGAAVLKGEGDAAEFNRILAAQKSRVRASRALFEQMPSALPDGGGGDGEDLDTARQTMLTGFGLVEQGLDTLAGFSKAPSEELLAQGTQKVEEGFVAMLGIQTIIERRKERSKA